MGKKSLGSRKLKLPSLASLRERARGFSLKDLLQQRELLLFAAMLLAILYTVYMLLVEPEQRRLVRAETEREQLHEEIDALSADGVEDHAASLQGELSRLEKDVKAAEDRWDELRRQGISEGVSRGEFLREITLVPYAFGWKILAMEQVSDSGSGANPFLGTVQYKVTGEGSFSGLFRYLQRIENSTVPARVTEMDLQQSGENGQSLHGSLLLRVMGIGDDDEKSPNGGNET